MSRAQNTGGGGQRDPEAFDRLAAAVDKIHPDLTPLVRAMNAAGVAVASQRAVLEQVSGVAAGSAWNGYTMARLQGRSREEARANPATGPLRDYRDYLGADADPPTSVPPRFESRLSPDEVV
jgi:hypothetical protein